MTYHTVYNGNVYVGLQYLRGNGQEGYIPCREYKNGIFTPNDTIFVRDIPSTSGNHIATYVSGESLTYHTIHMGNEYVWLQYSRGNGQQGYIPCREFNEELGELWGTINE